MSNKILITDSLFIFDEHIKKLETAGFEIERLDKPEATEAELIEAVKGKVGYILGGIEKVTDKVIEAADKLKVIAYTGTGYKGFIPAWKLATEKKIAIVNAPDGVTNAVAEWAIAATLTMNRGILELGKLGDKTFLTTKGIENQQIGIIGLGKIGLQIVKMLQPFSPKSISYHSKHRHKDSEKELKINYLELPELLGQSDILYVCVSDDAGKDFIDESKLIMMKQRALLVSFMHQGIINADALFQNLKSGHIRAILDNPMDERFDTLPMANWYCFKSSNAYNAESALKLTSDMATESVINILTTGKDQYKVN